MCTAILIYRVLDSFPIIIAANRDEFVDRPSRPPHLWEPAERSAGPRILAGRDLRAGGTWLGASSLGIVAGLTNRYTGDRDPGKRSRGGLVADCLARDSVEAIRERVAAEGAGMYNPFNLFVLSETAAAVVCNYPTHRWHPLAPGVHVVTNRAWGDADDAKRAWIERQLERVPDDPTSCVGRLEGLLANHGSEEEGTQVCLHLGGYGTVSSSILLLGKEPRESVFLHCEGKPCEHPYEDLSPLVRSLLGEG